MKVQFAEHLKHIGFIASTDPKQESANYNTGKGFNSAIHVMVIHDSNLDTVILVVLECRVCVDFGEAGKPGYPEKSPEAQERSTTGPVPPPPG